MSQAASQLPASAPPTATGVAVRLCATVAGAFGLGTILIMHAFPSDAVAESLAARHPGLPVALLLSLLAATLVGAWPCLRWVRAARRAPATAPVALANAAQRTALRIPLLVLRLGLPMVLGAAVLGLVLDLYIGVDLASAGRLAALRATVGIALSVPIYLMLRAILRPALLALGGTHPPGRLRLDLESRLLWAIPALTLTAAGPPALVAASHISGIEPGFEMGVLLAGLGLLLGAAAWTGQVLGRSVSDDVQRVARRVIALAERRPATAADPRRPRLAELSRLVEAINALLVRNAEIDAKHFVAIERLLEAEQVKVRFLAHMSHDLRAPLNTVLGFSDVLLSGVDGILPPGPRQVLLEIRQHSDRTLRMVSQVLEVARVEAGGVELRREACPPAEIVSQALRDLRGADERGIDLLAELQPGIPPVLVDGPRLAAALAGLLGYVIGEAEQGPVSLSVGTTGNGGSRAIEMRVQCIGLPIPADVAGDPLALRHLPRRRDLGLGPLLAQKIAELHGGTVTVQAGPDEGAIFCMRIPG